MNTALVQMSEFKAASIFFFLPTWCAPDYQLSPKGYIYITSGCSALTLLPPPTPDAETCPEAEFAVTGIDF